MKRFSEKFKQVITKSEIAEKEVDVIEKRNVFDFDFNFKRAVIEELLDKSPSFEDKIEQQRKA